MRAVVSAAAGALLARAPFPSRELLGGEAQEGNPEVCSLKRIPYGAAPVPPRYEYDDRLTEVSAPLWSGGKGDS